MLASEPPKVPMAERAALKTTTSLVIKKLLEQEKIACQIGVAGQPYIVNP
jgi:hypothetical protein